LLAGCSISSELFSHCREQIVVLGQNHSSIAQGPIRRRIREILQIVNRQILVSVEAQWHVSLWRRSLGDRRSRCSPCGCSRSRFNQRLSLFQELFMEILPTFQTTALLTRTRI
jgi:hypothetical protein